MFNSTDHRGQCPVPFLDESTFTNGNGNIATRLCTPIGPELRCCLPCPATDWVYPQTLKRYFTAGGAISAIGLACVVFLLASWIILPAEKTKRHAFGVCVTIGVGFICLAFVIGSSADPPQCFDEITPHDLFSSMICGFTGAFVVAGAIIVSTWTAVHAGTMHLQICWNVVPGKLFFWCTQALAWGVSAIIFTINITLTGFSYRFGPVCHINSHHALKHYWGLLFALSGLSAMFTLTTLTYSVYIYMKYHSMRPAISPHDSIDMSLVEAGTTPARLIYRRVTTVLWLSWRSVAIIVFVLTDIGFYAAVYVKLDHIIAVATDGTPQGLARVGPFLVCLIKHDGDQTKCFREAGKAIMPEATALAILMLLSVAGLQCFAMLARTSMFLAWRDLIRKTLRKNDEFVSVSAMPQPHVGHASSFHGHKSSVNETCSMVSHQQDVFIARECQEEYRSSMRPPDIVLNAPWAVSTSARNLSEPAANPNAEDALPADDRKSNGPAGSKFPRDSMFFDTDSDVDVELCEAKAMTVARVSKDELLRSQLDCQCQRLGVQGSKY